MLSPLLLVVGTEMTAAETGWGSSQKRQTEAETKATLIKGFNRFMSICLQHWPSENKFFQLQTVAQFSNTTLKDTKELLMTNWLNQSEQKKGINAMFEQEVTNSTKHRMRRS